MTPEREKEIRSACERSEFDREIPGDSPGEMMRDLLTALDEARAQLAAVREAVREVLDEPHAYVGGRERALLDAALSDTAAAAEAHGRHVRAEALRWEADRWSDQDDDVPRRLRERARSIAIGGGRCRSRCGRW